MVVSKKTLLFQGFRGSPNIFRGGGGGGVQRGPNANFYRNPYNLSFSRGESGPLSPLLTRSCSLSPSGSVHELPRENAQLIKDLGNTLSNQIFLSVIIKHSKFIRITTVILNWVSICL